MGVSRVKQNWSNKQHSINGLKYHTEQVNNKRLDIYIITKIKTYYLTTVSFDLRGLKATRKRVESKVKDESNYIYKALNDRVEIINYIKSQPKNEFENKCRIKEEMGCY